MLVHLSSIIYSIICYCALKKYKKGKKIDYVAEAKEINSLKSAEQFVDCLFSKERCIENQKTLNHLKSLNLLQKIDIKLPESKVLEFDLTNENCLILEKMVSYVLTHRERSF